jgi:hypothetical protein
VIPVVALIGGAIWWVSSRSSSSSESVAASQGSGAAAKGVAVSGSGSAAGSSSSGKAAISAPAAPTVPPMLAHQSIAQAWENDTRDQAWALDTETEIKRRVAKLPQGQALEDAACKRSSCRLTMHGSQAAVGDVIANLETEQGLRGLADNVVLSAPEKQPDGSILLRAYALFDR